MTERPITLTAEHVRSVLDGRKTQHRIPVKFPFYDCDTKCLLAGNELAGEIAAGNYLNSKFGKPGDRLWVRETFGFSIRSVGGGPHQQLVFRASRPDAVHFYDCNGKPSPMKWRPSIHMPREYSRITLEITGVRVERLNSMTEHDALAEGCLGGHGSIPGYMYSATPHEHFHHVWESIYGADSWQADPWVWVIEFKRVEAGK